MKTKPCSLTSSATSWRLNQPGRRGLFPALWCCGLALCALSQAAEPPGVSIPIQLVYRTAECPRGLLPVVATVFFEQASPADPGKSPWLLERETAAGQWEPWPFQLEPWRPTVAPSGQPPAWTGQLSFFPPEDAVRRSVLRLRQLLPDERVPVAAQGAFRLTEDAAGWTVENEKIRFHLDGTASSGSGQLAAVTLLTESGSQRIDAKLGAIHRNPDILVHGRPWAHAHKWNPPENTLRHTGPLVIEIIRSGPFPGVPEATLRIRYRFFAGRSFMESATEVEFMQDLALVSLRNDQLIFTPGTFSHFGWRETGGVHSRRFADTPAINAHGDLMKLWPDTPWILFWNEKTGASAGTVRLAEFNTGPAFATPVSFDRSTYIMDRKGEVQSWMRPLVYLNVSWSRKKGLHLPAGTRFSEVNHYFFSGAGRDPAHDLADRLHRESQSLPLIQVGPGAFPPVP